jgi:endoglucanase
MRRITMASMLALTACGGSSGGGSTSTPVAAAPAPAPAPTSAPTASPTPTSTVLGNYTPAAARLPTTGATLRLGKCINLSDMLEAPREGDWGRAFRDDDVANIKGQGFTALRLPVRFSSHAGTAAPYTIDPAFLARVRHIVDLAVAADMAVIVDMHHYEELFTDPAGHTARFAALWRQVAVALRDEPASVSFELINEPHDKLTAANLASVITPALAAVRESNPTRAVVIDGPSYASLAQMASTPMPPDPNVVPTFHYYTPDNFGLPSASYMTPATRDSWGTAADLAELDANVASLRTYMATTGRVPFVGEYGAAEQRPAAERAKYYATVSAAFASVGVQSCAWGYDNTFNLYTDTGGWLAAAVSGIRTTTTLP